MDPRHPVPFGPFPSSHALAEENRAAAGRAFSSVTAQIAVALGACLAMGLATMLAWHQLTIYEAALAACAGV